MYEFRPAEQRVLPQTDGISSNHRNVYAKYLDGDDEVIITPPFLYEEVLAI